MMAHSSLGELDEDITIGNITLLIKDASDERRKKKALETKTWSTIQDVKHVLQQKLHIPISRQRLFYRGRELRNAHTLATCGLFRDRQTVVLAVAPEPGDALLPLARPLNENCPRDLARTLTQAQRALELNIVPELAMEGTGGTYFLKDARKRPLGAFKPGDEEPFMPNNPRGFEPGSAGGAGGEALSMRPGVRAGEAYLREVAAYLLDQSWGGLAGVPATALALAQHSAFRYADGRVRPKVGSFQAFVRAEEGCAGDHAPARLPAAEVHKVALLDLRLLNGDRNDANLLVRRRRRPRPAEDGGAGAGAGAGGASAWELELIPIDHGYCLPERVEIGWCDLCWLEWPQLRAPLSPALRAAVLALDPAAEARRLGRRLGGLRPLALRHCRAAHALLVAGVGRGLSLRGLADLVVREDLDRPSAFERALGRAADLARADTRDKARGRGLGGLALGLRELQGLALGEERGVPAGLLPPSPPPAPGAGAAAGAGGGGGGGEGGERGGAPSPLDAQSRQASAGSGTSGEEGPAGLPGSRSDSGRGLGLEFAPGGAGGGEDSPEGSPPQPGGGGARARGEEEGGAGGRARALTLLGSPRLEVPGTPSMTGPAGPIHLGAGAAEDHDPERDSSTGSAFSDAAAMPPLSLGSRGVSAGSAHNGSLSPEKPGFWVRDMAEIDHEMANFRLDPGEEIDWATDTSERPGSEYRGQSPATVPGSAVVFYSGMGEDRRLDEEAASLSPRPMAPPVSRHNSTSPHPGAPVAGAPLARVASISQPLRGAAHGPAAGGAGAGAGPAAGGPLPGQGYSMTPPPPRSKQLLPGSPLPPPAPVPERGLLADGYGAAYGNPAKGPTYGAAYSNGPAYGAGYGAGYGAARTGDTFPSAAYGAAYGAAYANGPAPGAPCGAAGAEGGPAGEGAGAGAGAAGQEGAPGGGARWRERQASGRSRASTGWSLDTSGDWGHGEVPSVPPSQGGSPVVALRQPTNGGWAAAAAAGPGAAAGGAGAGAGAWAGGRPMQRVQSYAGFSSPHMAGALASPAAGGQDEGGGHPHHRGLLGNGKSRFSRNGRIAVDEHSKAFNQSFFNFVDILFQDLINRKKNEEEKKNMQKQQQQQRPS